MSSNVPLPKPRQRKVKTKSEATSSAAQQAVRSKQRLAAIKREQAKLEEKLKSTTAVEAVLEGKTAVVDLGDLEKATPTVKEHVTDREVIFAPNPGPQTEFLAASEREVLYGGAAGGGKSYAMIVDPLRYCHIPDHTAILFRRTNDQLREIINKSKGLYPKAFPGAKWSEQKSTWTFPSGATIWYTYLDRDDDVLRYQGQAFNWIGFDELTNWPTPYPWDYMRSRLRTTNPELPLCMRATTNPGGPGASWVRKMFIEVGEWGLPFDATDIETGEVLTYPRFLQNGQENPRWGEPLFQRRFIPAKLSDNPYYANGEYYTNLLSLPEAQRRQLLEGDWDVCEGAAFSEFNRNIHVCEPFEIPHNWTKFRAADWGYTKPACCLWFAVDYDDNVYVYRELYINKKNAEEFADMVLDLEANDEQIRYGVLDASAWQNKGDVGPTIAETMIRRGCMWRPSDRRPNSRQNGKLEVHRRLKPFVDEETGLLTARVKIFSTCRNLIRTLPILPMDKNNVEDVDTKADDHAYDAFRYGLSSRPMAGTFNYDNRNPMRQNTYVAADSSFGY